MLSLTDNNQAEVVEAFNSTLRYLDDLLNIDNPYFEQMVSQIYPTELQLNKANSINTESFRYWVGLRCVSVVFPDQSHLLFVCFRRYRFSFNQLLAQSLDRMVLLSNNRFLNCIKLRLT